LQATIRILIVDDFEPFRRFVESTLSQKPEWQIVGEVGDGPQAVQLARALQPDLMVLDIGLPTLDGIETARRVSECAPKTRILFLTANRSETMVQEALRTGAAGYVLKSNATKELLPALEAVLEGKRFVSVSLNHHESGC